MKDLKSLEESYKETSMDAIFIESMDDTTMEQITEAKRKAKVAELNLKLARMEARG